MQIDVKWIAETYGGWAVLFLAFFWLYKQQVSKNENEERRRDELDAQRLKMELQTHEVQRRYEAQRDARLEMVETQRLSVLQAIEKNLLQMNEHSHEHTSALERLATLLDNHETNATDRSNQLRELTKSTADATQANSRSLTGQIIGSIEQSKSEIINKIETIIMLCDKTEVIKTLREIKELLEKQETL